MKRTEIINNLIKEGFSEKTLVRFNDKQLLTLQKTLEEQGTTQIPNVSTSDVKTLTALKQSKKPFMTYEGEVSEDDDMKEASRTMANGYHGGLKKMKYKAGSKAKCVPPPIKKKKKLHEADSMMLAKRNLSYELKEAGVSDLDIENGDINELAIQYSENHQGVRDAHDLYKRINGKDMSMDRQTSGMVNETKKWVEKLVENKYRSVTTKNEIMNLITSKLNEQEVQFGPKVKKGHNGIPQFMTYDAITSNNPSTKPTTEPNPTIAPGKPKERPKPKTPYRPGPGINPAPKGGISPAQKNR